MNIEVGLENLQSRIKKDIHHFILFCYEESLLTKNPAEIKKVVAEKIRVKENKINVFPKRVYNGNNPKAVRMTIRTKTQLEKTKALKKPLRLVKNSHLP